MKIGIITHHYVKNYGAFLQMKGTYETLKAIYPEADIRVIDFVVQKHWIKNIIHVLHYRRGIDTPLTYIKKIKQLRVFTQYERSIPRTKKVKNPAEIKNLGLDMIIIGSDEVWNLHGSGYSPVKFGTGLEDSTIVAYAPSVGAVTSDSQYPQEIVSGLRNIDRVSARDSETVKFIDRVANRKSELMLDPTFLFNFDVEIAKEKVRGKDFEYILIYDCKLTKSMIEQLVSFAKSNKLKIIGAGDFKTFYDEVSINLTPYEWVNLFRNASMVITGTFHGTVFSIKYNKQVVCYPTEKNRINKISSLLSQMGLYDRLLRIGEESEMVPLLGKQMDYTFTNEYISKKQKEAFEFLGGNNNE